MTVSLHDQSGPLLAQQAPTQPEFSTTVYDKQLADADKDIAKVIHENASAGDGAEQQQAPK